VGLDPDQDEFVEAWEIYAFSDCWRYVNDQERIEEIHHVLSVTSRNRQMRRNRDVQRVARRMETLLSRLRSMVASAGRHPSTVSPGPTRIFAVRPQEYVDAVIQVDMLERMIDDAVVMAALAETLTLVIYELSCLCAGQVERAGELERGGWLKARSHAPPPGHQVATQPVCPHGPPRQPAAPPEWATAGWLAA